MPSMSDDAVATSRSPPLVAIRHAQSPTTTVNNNASSKTPARPSLLRDDGSATALRTAAPASKYAKPASSPVYYGHESMMPVTIDNIGFPTKSSSPPAVPVRTAPSAPAMPHARPRSAQPVFVPTMPLPAIPIITFAPQPIDLMPRSAPLPNVATFPTFPTFPMFQHAGSNRARVQPALELYPTPLASTSAIPMDNSSMIATLQSDPKSMSDPLPPQLLGSFKRKTTSKFTLPPGVDLSSMPARNHPDFADILCVSQVEVKPIVDEVTGDTTYQCPICMKTYGGKHARSIWKRHLSNKHEIPLNMQPRRTRWDNDNNRPKDEAERHKRTLDSKRRWAAKNRAEKRAKRKQEAGIPLDAEEVALLNGTSTLWGPTPQEGDEDYLAYQAEIAGCDEADMSLDIHDLEPMQPAAVQPQQGAFDLGRPQMAGQHHAAMRPSANASQNLQIQQPQPIQPIPIALHNHIVSSDMSRSLSAPSQMWQPPTLPTSTSDVQQSMQYSQQQALQMIQEAQRQNLQAIQQLTGATGATPVVSFPADYATYMAKMESLTPELAGLQSHSPALSHASTAPSPIFSFTEAPSQLPQTHRSLSVAPIARMPAGPLHSPHLSPFIAADSPSLVPLPSPSLLTVPHAAPQLVRTRSAPTMMQVPHPSLAMNGTPSPSPTMTDYYQQLLDHETRATAQVVSPNPSDPAAAAVTPSVLSMHVEPSNQNTRVNYGLGLFHRDPAQPRNAASPLLRSGGLSAMFDDAATTKTMQSNNTVAHEVAAELHANLATTKDRATTANPVVATLAAAFTETPVATHNSQAEAAEQLLALKTSSSPPRPTKRKDRRAGDDSGFVDGFDGLRPPSHRALTQSAAVHEHILLDLDLESSPVKSRPLRAKIAMQQLEQCTPRTRTRSQSRLISKGEIISLDSSPVHHNRSPANKKRKPSPRKSPTRSSAAIRSPEPTKRQRPADIQVHAPSSSLPSSLATPMHLTAPHRYRTRGTSQAGIDRPGNPFAYDVDSRPTAGLGVLSSPGDFFRLSSPEHAAVSKSLGLVGESMHMNAFALDIFDSCAGGVSEYAAGVFGGTRMDGSDELLDPVASDVQRDRFSDHRRETIVSTSPST